MILIFNFILHHWRGRLKRLMNY